MDENLKKLTEIIFTAKEKEKVYNAFLHLREAICLKHYPEFNVECDQCHQQAMELTVIKTLAFIPRKMMEDRQNESTQGDNSEKS